MYSFCKQVARTDHADNAAICARILYNQSKSEPKTGKAPRLESTHVGSLAAGMASSGFAERSPESTDEDSGLWSLLSLFPFCYVQSNHTSTVGETKVVHLRSDVPEGHLPKPSHDLGEHDTIDTTLGPSRNKRAPQPSVMTPRQHCFKEAVQLPKLLRYPSLPKDFMANMAEDGSFGSGEREQQERETLLKMFQDFALDMHRGRYLTQLGSNQDYSVIHCRLAAHQKPLRLLFTSCFTLIALCWLS